MKKVREVVSLALKQRVDAGVKVRQPLGKLFVKSDINKKLLSLIQEEVNVKEVVIDNKIEQEVQLDLNITPELKEEGDFREVARTIQTLRKQAGLIPEDKITLYYQGEGFENFFEKWKENLKKETGTEKIKKQKTETPKAQKNTKINNREIEITIE
jgi:isoleucyl-tRNA synthetase